jgi:ribosomal protein L11 methyltransferase
VLLVDPQGAFPPSHPATRLCLDLLTTALAAAPVQCFLDVGCGSGVLALAAAALGVPVVVGVDLAPQAVRATWRNAHANGLAHRLQVIQGSTECLRGPFDLVAANLHPDVHRAKVPELLRLAGSRGRLLLAGFREPEEAELRAAYGARCRQPAARRTRGFTPPGLPSGLSFVWVAWLLLPPAG